MGFEAHLAMRLKNFNFESQIVPTVASSGIAARLLEERRTANSALELPLNLQTIDEPMCNIAKNQQWRKY